MSVITVAELPGGARVIQKETGGLKGEGHQPEWLKIYSILAYCSK